jgi:hypothetical protein
MLAADSFSGGRRYSARLPITVAGENIEGVNLRLVPPVQLTGRIQIEGAVDFPFRQVIVNLEARFSKLTAGGAASEDGSLLLNNIVPDLYQLNVVVPDGYYLKSAKCSETDVLRSGLDLSHGAPGHVELEIGADGGSIEGSVVDGDKQPVDGVRVGLVPEDPASGLWRQKVAITNPQGGFSIRGIAPGDYKLYASRSLAVGALQDPAYVNQLEPLAKSVSIHEHGVVAVRVTVIAADGLPSQ